MSTVQLAFERLKGRENFSSWKVGAKAHLITKGHWSFMTASTVAAADQSKDEKALAELTLMVDPCVYSHLEECTTAKQGWDTLMTAFEDKGVVRKVSLLKQWISLRLADCESMQDYVNKCLTLRSKVKSAGFKIDEEIAGSIMLCGLSDAFKPMVMSIETKADEISVDFVKNILLQEIDFENSANETALAVNQKRSNKNENKDKKKKTVKCFECGGPHFRKKCPKLKNTEANVVLYSSFVAQNGVSSEWIIDSGASAHMTPCESLLKNRSMPSVKEVTVANNEKLSINCVGDIEQKIGKSGKVGSITLKDVQYIPGICVNLLSVSKIVQHDKEVIFNKHGCKILDSDKNIVATGSLVNNMFKLDIVPEPKEFVCLTKIDDFKLWHKRLGHASFGKMSALLDFKNIKKVNDLKCVVCIKGKQAKLPFKHKGSRATCLLERIHSDVCGPIQIQSIGGAKFFVTFIDDYSRKVFVYALKSKSDVFTKLVEFKKLVENQLQKKIKIFRSDNGTEYGNKNFAEFFVSCGIKHEKSAVYTPQQNGLAERMNRSLVEKVRCMLLDSNMSKGFWAEALCAAVNIMNVLPNAEGIAPDELWFKEKPDISMIKVFGCKAMTLIPKENRRKLDEKSADCVYLRQADDAKAYRLYNKNTKKIVISRDVVFFENSSNAVNENNEKSNDFFFISYEGEANDDEQNNRNNVQSVNTDLTENRDGIIDSGENDINESIIENFTDAAENITISSSDDSMHDDTKDDPTYTTTAVVPTETRSSARIRGFNFMNAHVAFLMGEPNTYNEAIRSNEKQKWIDAMREEYNSLVKNCTWKLVDRPVGQRIVDNRWVFKVKRNTDDSIERYKARLVARGFTQEYGVNYFETFSPVVRFTSIRIILAIAAKRKMHMKQFDVKTAFLNGELNENVYMEQPIGFRDGTNKVCKLEKSLYGLKQASRCWNRKFKHFIEIFGFFTCKADPCVFVSKRNGELIILAIHVDDGLIVADNICSIEAVIKHLQEHFEIKLMDVGCFLGLQIEQRDDGIFIHQAAYTRRILERFQMEDSNAVMTPGDPNQILHKFDEAESSSFPYRELIGSLMYLVVATRPDIAHAVGIVSRYMENPTMVHEKAAKKILRYIKGTINFGIFFSDSEDTKLTGYSDADYAGDPDTRRSTSGYAFMFGESILSWGSERQKSVSLSTTESEYMAASNAVKELIWLRSFMNELLPDKIKCVSFLMDNQSAIRLIKNPEFHKRSKHIDVRFHFIREKYENDLFSLNYICSREMIADIFTKALAKERFHYLRGLMGVVDKSEI